MKQKWILFAGIVLLIVGIIIRKTSGFAIEGLVMIITGVLFKTYYIVSKARSGAYKPGNELWFLIIGLSMFLSGLYIRSNESQINPAYLIFTGLALKVVFIILFILKTKKSKNQ